ncbi:EF-hand domain-containing protein [Trichonephila clavipes]|uniref:EF-hand domain-containing protein n=1 Tax=Trichonephila clavipes TaxID=2585209 RepID=A0A8X6WKW3_TRICX|nr:EF-hand domain-containing protein [Trichonephila clavipes]
MASLREEVAEYIKKYKIKELLQHLSEMVLYFKPENPVEFLANVLLDMKTSIEKGENVEFLYQEESLRAYFRLLDPANEGVISWEQLKSALKVLGIKDVDAPILKQGPVTIEVFLDVCKRNFLKNLGISLQ